CWQVLLWRYSGEKDVVVGSAVAQRPTVESEKLIGMMVNLVAMRTEVEERKSYRELLEQVKGTVMEGHRYEYVPFEKVVEEVEKRGGGGRELVQVVLAWQSGMKRELRLGEVVGRVEGVETGTAKFDVTITMGEGEGGEIEGSVEYSVDLFREETVRNLISHFRHLMRSAATYPDLPVGQLETLSPEEKQQILASGAASTLPTDSDETVLKMFASHVSVAPAHTAIECLGACLSYAELDQRANDLAYSLQQLGVREETLVGICLRRSPAAIVAMLAVLKAGGAYLSLDPANPSERLLGILQDSGAQVLCTESCFTDKFQGQKFVVVTLDAESPRNLKETANTPQTINRLAIDSLAYLIYTSGSTGQPKGVHVTHRGLRNLVRWHSRAFSLSTADRTTQLASLGFDASVWEIWSALANGTTLCIVPDEVVVSPPDLRDWLLNEKITVSFLPTPLAEEIVALSWPLQTALRALLTGGDKLRTSPPRRLPFAFFNNYGPTECAVVSTSGQVIADSHVASPPSIGRPISNFQVRVLDSDYRLQPSGVPGELFIAGEGLARGYWKRPDITAERFVPDPFSEIPGSRLYRTGDRVRLLPNGELAFLGRL